MNRPLVLALAAMLSLAACSKNEPAPAAAPAAPVAPQAKAGAVAPNTGKVLEVVQAGSYTYAEVQGGQGQRAWIAGTHLEVKAGDTVQWGEYAVMRNFNAKSINRVFPEVLFVNSWGLAGAATMPTPVHGSLPTPGTPGMVDVNSQGKIKSVANAGGYSYVEVDRGGSTVWLAAMETPMKAGDTIKWETGTEMRNFTVKSLSRTFEHIIFTNAVTVSP